MRRFVIFVLSLILSGPGWAQENFRVCPYLQNPAPDGMTVIWFTSTGEPGQLSFGKQNSIDSVRVYSTPEPAPALGYSVWEDTLFFKGEAPQAPYRHRVRMTGLEPATAYTYSLVQGLASFSGEFRTAPQGDTSIRFVVYSDSETEPESTGVPAGWADTTGSGRTYLVDQTTGYRNNLEVIRSREPDLVLIAGDLVQHGGEQRDWDEFWRHNAGTGMMPGLAGDIPLMPALGNHEYYADPATGTGGGYSQPQSETAVDKYQTYFEVPENYSPNVDQEGRYYSLDYGPATFIVLDLCNNSPNISEEDTNFYLRGENDSAGGNAPDFGPGSRQHMWLEEQLAAAQGKLFTFVLFHHAPYSSGPHAYPPGSDLLQDRQSGVPVRQLTPLFLKYGVDAIFSGHDEMWERSEVTGTEDLPDGSSLPKTLHFYDVGIGGDGLRGPYEGTGNPYQVFLAHKDAPEVWEDTILVSGGKHYGHLEVNIQPVGEGLWEALLDPVYVLPLKEPGDSVYSGFTRKLYNDRVSLVRQGDTSSISSGTFPHNLTRGAVPLLLNCYPNPFREKITITMNLPRPGPVSFTIFDLMGRVVYSRESQPYIPGTHRITWEGRSSGGENLPSGIYQCLIVSGTGSTATIRMVKH